jgi:hypothetical protein
MTHNSLLQQFRFFYFRNYPDDMETQIQYFSIFGGLDITIDTTKPLEELIEHYILQNFTFLNEQIELLTLNMPSHKRLLHALAKGDRRIFSAFNKAKLNNGNGGAALNFLEEKGIIQLEYSRETHPKERYPKKKLKREEARHRISHKVLFTAPFLRFWFYFVLPHTKEIAEKNYTSFFKNFEIKSNSYTSLIFEELSEILLNYHLRDEIIESSGSYWDAKTEIDILMTTAKKSIYIGECKWSNHKINKKELHKLKDKCEKLHIEPTQIIFFAKRGFSKELQNLESKALALYSCEDFEVLLKQKSTHNTQSFIRLT